MKFLYFTLLTFTLLFAFSFGKDCKVGKHEFNKGEKYQPPGECDEITCDGPGSIYSVGCPAQRAHKPCVFIPTDLSKPYPQCCARYKCP